MIFGPVPISEAEGAILAHAARLADGRISKAPCCRPRMSQGLPMPA